MVCACREEQFCVYPFQSTSRCTLGCAGYALPIGQVLFSALPYLYFVRHGRVLSLYPLKPEDNQKGCFRTLACVLLSCASHPVEVTASVDIYPSRISRGKSTPCQIAPAANNTAFFSTRLTSFAYLAAVNFIHWSFSLPPSTKGLQRNPQLHRRPFPKVRYSSHCILLHKPKGQLTTSRITPLTRNFATVTSERCHIFIILYLCIGMLPDEPSIGTEPNFSSFK